MTNFAALIVWLSMGIIAVHGATSMTINCHYQMMEHVNNDPEVYTCIAQDVTVTNNDVTVTGATGTHMSGKSDGDVRMVFFANSPKMNYLPRDVIKPFPNARGLRVIDSGISFIDRSTFREMGQLSVMDLENNTISVVPEDTFYDMPKLTYLSVAGNHISYLSPELLKGMKELIVFGAHRNQLESIGSSFFHDNTKLRVMMFDFNRIHSIGPKLASFLPDLQAANFNQNLCTNMIIYNDNQIVSKLTSEITLKCAVNCEKSQKYAQEREQKLSQQLDNAQALYEQVRAEKQSLRYEGTKNNKANSFQKTNFLCLKCLSLAFQFQFQFQFQ